jgi:hypothetical protein
MSGYVRIHRSLIGHPAFRNDAEAMAFAWLVAKAAWKQTRVRYKGHDIVLERGQLTISIRDFAERLDRPKGWAERLFARLREHGMIDQKNRTQVGTQVGTHGGTVGGTAASVITICNYGEYQAEALFDETVRKTPAKTQVRQAQDTEQEREEEKNISSEPKGSSPRAWALPVGVALQVWQDFKRNRERKRLPNTETAWKTFNDDLKRISSQTGIPPPKLIEMCAAKGWASINDPREGKHGRTNFLGRNQPADGLSSTARAALEVFGR